MPLILPKNQVTLAITINQGKVVIKFNRPTDQVVLSPDEAAQVAHALARSAADLVPAGVSILLPPGVQRQ